MRGLQVTHHLDEKDYLAFVHDVPVEERLQPDPGAGCASGKISPAKSHIYQR